MKKIFATIIFLSLFGLASAQQEVMYAKDWNQTTGLVKSFEFNNNVYIGDWFSVYSNTNGTFTPKGTYMVSNFKPIIAKSNDVWKITFDEKIAPTNQ